MSQRSFEECIIGGCPCISDLSNVTSDGKVIVPGCNPVGTGATACILQGNENVVILKTRPIRGPDRDRLIIDHESQRVPAGRFIGFTMSTWEGINNKRLVLERGFRWADERTVPIRQTGVIQRREYYHRYLAQIQVRRENRSGQLIYSSPEGDAYILNFRTSTIAINTGFFKVLTVKNIWKL